MIATLLSFRFLDAASFDEWLSQNAIWLAFSLAGLILLCILLAVFIPLAKRKGKAPKKPTPSKSLYMEALGGEDNVISHLRKGSRIELRLKDYSLINKEKIKEAGVDGFLQMSDRLTLVIQGDAERVEKTLFGEETPKA